jgi:hypothetical protein
VETLEVDDIYNNVEGLDYMDSKLENVFYRMLIHAQL